MKILQGLAAFTLMVPAVSQPALAEIVHIKLTGLFTIGDRRGQDFAVELKYDTEIEPTTVAGTTATFKDPGGIMLFTIGDRRADAELARARAVPTYLSTVYDLSPPTAVMEQTPDGRRLTFYDPSGSLGTISFFYDRDPPLTQRLPGLAGLGQFSGGVVTFNGDGKFGQGSFTYAPFAAGVPEPATWGMMILGFGAVGAAMRMRRRKISISYT